MQRIKSIPITTYLTLFLIVLFGCSKKTIRPASKIDCIEKSIGMKNLTNFNYALNCKLKEEFIESYFIIENCKMFNKIMDCVCDSKIDFSKYVLIVGAKQFGSGTRIYEEKVTQKCNQITYSIIFDNRGMSMNAPVMNYGVIIEKPENGIKILMREIIWTPKEMN